MSAETGVEHKKRLLFAHWVPCVSFIVQLDMQGTLLFLKRE
jgi:hypothetical protein